METEPSRAVRNKALICWWQYGINVLEDNEKESHFLVKVKAITWYISWNDILMISTGSGRCEVDTEQPGVRCVDGKRFVVSSSFYSACSAGWNDDRGLLPLAGLVMKKNTVLAGNLRSFTTKRTCWLSIEKVAFRKREQKTLAARRTNNVHVRRQNQALEVGKSAKDDGS